MNQDFFHTMNDYGLKAINQDGIGWKCTDFQVRFPPQHQNVQPGMEYLMMPKPVFDNPNYKASGKLLGKVDDIYNTGANDIYVVKDELGKQILLPGIKEVIKNVDLDGEKITVHLIPGLI